MAPTAAPISFSVRYDEPTLRAAAWAFVRAAAFGRRGVWGLAALALAFGALWFVFSRREWTFYDGFFLAGLVVYAALLALTYALHLDGMRANVARTQTKASRVTLSEDEIETVVDSGSARFPWRSFAERVERGGVMLLVMSRNQFVTLPLRDTPHQAQEFLRRKIPKLAG